MQPGKSEVIAIDAVEETRDGKIKILVALAVAEVRLLLKYTGEGTSTYCVFVLEGRRRWGRNQLDLQSTHIWK